jgi:hypothetical protein
MGEIGGSSPPTTTIKSAKAPMTALEAESG